MNMAGSPYNSLRKKFTELVLRNVSIPILNLHITKYAKIHVIDTSCEVVFNNENVQIYANGLSRTPPQKLKHAKLLSQIIGTKPLCISVKFRAFLSVHMGVKTTRALSCVITS